MQEKDKVKKKRKRKKKRYLLKFFILLILAASLYFFFSSSMFDIQKITVENNNHYTKEQLISLAGVRTGENLFKASLSQMKENLLADPYVKNVKLRKRLPAEVVISVQERSEDAAVPYGNKYILIDSEGMVLRISDIEPAVTLITGTIYHQKQELRHSTGEHPNDLLNRQEVPLI